MPSERPVYPFSAMIGQEKLKLALLLNAINPRIGGVLITGANGTGKSSIVRALSDLLPKIEVIKNCPFNCDPEDPTNMCLECSSRLKLGKHQAIEKRKMRVVQLPLSATEDRVIGALDTEKALREGLKSFQPGILADANQNILYIDEVNLLPDYLVHTILDPASSGWNIVQRESISLSHPSRFILIASMNPEEGDLSPQLRDRFALHVNVETINDVKQRIQIMSKNILFEEDPIAFRKIYEPEQVRVRQKIESARKLLPKIKTPDSIFETVARVCADLQVDGHRPDIVTIKAAEAMAALNGRTNVEPEDIFTVLELALSHRIINSMTENVEPQETIYDALEQNLAELKLERPSRTEKTLREYNNSEIEETIERISKILQTQKSSLRQSSTKRRKGSKNISLLMLPILIPVALYITSIILLMFYYMFFGFPTEGISAAFSFERILLPMTGVAAIALVLFLFVQRRKKPSPVIFFRTKGGTLSRQIVPQHGPSKQSNIEGRESLVALRGTTLENVKKTIKSFGRKIEKNLNLLGPSKERFQVSLDQRIKSRSTLIGKHSKAITLSQRGRYVWYEFPKKRPWDIALAPTIRSAAPHQITRKPQDLKVKIDSQDVRVKVRETRTPSTVLLLIDMSESMAISLDNIRAAVMNLHKNVYHQRDRVGLIVFKGNEAFAIQPPTSNLNLVMRKLIQVGASDFTPLAAGMVKAWQLFRIEKYRNKEIIPILVMISDGIANVPLERPLSPFTRQRFMNSSQADVIDAAFLLAKSNIQTIVINPDHRLEERYPKIESRGLGWYTPINLLLEITRIVQGRYYGITEKGDIQSTIMTEAITSITRRRSKR